MFFNLLLFKTMQLFYKSCSRIYVVMGLFYYFGVLGGCYLLYQLYLFLMGPRPAPGAAPSVEGGGRAPRRALSRTAAMLKLKLNISELNPILLLCADEVGNDFEISWLF